MTLKEALEKLKLTKYHDDIYHSHSSGELFHVYSYIDFALFADNDVLINTFNKYFIEYVNYAEKNWERPASVYQHIVRGFFEKVISETNKQ